MGMHHLPLTLPDRHTTTQCISARLYPANALLPKPVAAQVRKQGQQPDRFVHTADVLSGQKLQPYTHDIALTIEYRGTVYRFLVFFKKHKMLPPNLCVQNLGAGAMDGDILLVARGTKVAVRNLRGKDENRAADRAVKRLVEALNPIRDRRRFPRSISFV